MAIVGKAEVKVVPDTTGFAKDAEHGIVGSMGGIAKKAALAFGTAFAAAGIGRFIGNAIEEASAIGEATSKVGVVFGQASADVLAFAETSAEAFGISEKAALDYSGTFGNLLRSLGLAEDKSADMSTSLVALAGDLASFNNVSVDEALEALRSGLVGETEPLKKFGVNLNEATLKAKALELGLLDVSVNANDVAKAQEAVRRATQKQADAIAKNGAGSEQARKAAFDLDQANQKLATTLEGKVPAQLDAATKASAAYAIILEQTGLAAGDFGRTLETSLPNQLRVVKASFDDLKAGVGEALVPIALDFIKAINDNVLPAISGLAGALAPALEPLAQIVGPLADALAGAVGAVLPAVEALAPVFVSVIEAFSPLLPLIGEVVSALTGPLGTAIGGLVAAFSPVIATFAETATKLLDAFAPVLDILANLFVGVGQIFADQFAESVELVAAVLTEFAPVIAEVAGLLGSLLTENLSTITGIFAQLAPVAIEIGKVFADALGKVLPIIGEALTSMLPAIEAVAAALGGGLAAVLPELATALVSLAPVIAQLAQLLAGALSEALIALAPVIGSLAETLTTVLAAAVPVVRDVLASLMPIIERLAPLFAQLAGTVLTRLAGLFEKIATAILPILPVLGDLIGIVVELAAEVLDELLPVMPELIDALIELNTVSITLLEAIAPLLPPLLELATILVKTLAVPILLNVARALALIADAFSDLVGAISRGVKGAIGAVVDFLLHLDELPEKVGAILQDVIGFFRDLPGNLLDVGTEIARSMPGIIAEAFGGLGNLTTELLGEVVDAFAELPDLLLDLLGDLTDAGVELGKSILEGLLDGLTDVGRFFGDIGDALTDALKGAWNTFVEFLNEATPNSIPLPGLPDIPLPDNPWNFLRLAKGGIVMPRTGGVPAFMGEAGVAEAAIPLPPGVLEGLRALGRAGGRNGPTIQIYETRAPRLTARETVLALRSDEWLGGV